MIMTAVATTTGGVNGSGDEEGNAMALDSTSSTGSSTVSTTMEMEESCVGSTGEERRWAVADKWMFTEEQLNDTPSRKCGVDALLETKYRRYTAKFISDLAGCLQVRQLTANSGIVMMHRFYMYHSFTKFNLFETAMSCLFVACKGEEQLRKIYDLARHAYILLTKPVAISATPADNFTRSISMYKRRLVDGESLEAIIEEMISKIVDTELILLGTLGFDLSIEQAHIHVAQGCKDLSLPADISKKAYLFANASLISTRMCLRHMPKFVACVCIAAAMKECGWDFRGYAGKEWWLVIDKNIQLDMLSDVATHFLRSQQYVKTPVAVATNCIVAKGIINGGTFPNGANGMSHGKGIRLGVGRDCSVIHPYANGSK